MKYVKKRKNPMVYIYTYVERTKRYLDESNDVYIYTYVEKTKNISGRTQF